MRAFSTPSTPRTQPSRSPKVRNTLHTHEDSLVRVTLSIARVRVVFSIEAASQHVVSSLNRQQC